MPRAGLAVRDLPSAAHPSGELASVVRYSSLRKPAGDLLAADASRHVEFDVPAGHPWIAWDSYVLPSGHSIADGRNFGHESDTEGLEVEGVSNLHR